jgi:hypothetical protein
MGVPNPSEGSVKSDLMVVDKTGGSPWSTNDDKIGF